MCNVLLYTEVILFIVKIHSCWRFADSVGDLIIIILITIIIILILIIIIIVLIVHFYCALCRASEVAR